MSCFLKYNLSLLLLKTFLKKGSEKYFKILMPFLWVGFTCLKATEALRGDNLLFITQSLEVPELI